jgi:hypothetical protein
MVAVDAINVANAYVRPVEKVAADALERLAEIQFLQRNGNVSLRGELLKHLIDRGRRRDGGVSHVRRIQHGHSCAVVPQALSTQVARVIDGQLVWAPNRDIHCPRELEFYIGGQNRVEADFGMVGQGFGGGEHLARPIQNLQSMRVHRYIGNLGRVHVCVGRFGRFCSARQAREDK